MGKIKKISFKLLVSALLVVYSIYCLPNSIPERGYHTIPIEVKNGFIFLKIEIEGKERTFNFDSGSNTPIIIFANIAKKIKDLRYTGECKKYTDVTGKIYCQDAFILKKAKSGKYIAKDIAGRNYQAWGMHFSTQQGKEIDRTISEDGVIGFNFFQVDELVIDYPQKKLIASKYGSLPPSYAKDKCYLAPLSIDENGLVVEATYENKKGKFLLDTGSTASAIKKKTISNQIDKVNVKKLSIGNGEFGPITFWVVDFSEPAVNGILGYDFFSKNRVHINFQEKTLKVCPSGSTVNSV